MKNTIRYYIPSIAMFVIFAVFTVMVKTVNVAPIGPFSSSVGFASINGWFADRIGYNETLYRISELLGYAAIGVALAFAVMGLIQLIKGKSIKKVDIRLLLLACFYVLTGAFYVLFEVLVINYRPVLEDGVLEASYPSSHTVLGVCIFGTAFMLAGSFLYNKKIRMIVLRVLFLIAAAALVVLRFLSGVHWFTDIAGGLFLSLALCLLYLGGVRAVLSSGEKND